MLPDGASWWHGYDPDTGEERSCSDGSLPNILLGGETAFVGSPPTDGTAGHPSPWGEPAEVECDGFDPGDLDKTHVLCLCCELRPGPGLAPRFQAFPPPRVPRSGGGVVAYAPLPRAQLGGCIGRSTLRRCGFRAASGAGPTAEAG